jgi:hypothetical protein
VKEGGEIYRSVQAVIPHPNYNSNTMDFDFALLKLASPVALSANVSYICLPPGIFKREICITLMMMFSKFYFSQ